MIGLFLHEVPYHLHRGIGVLQVASWIAIGTAGTALVLTWGRILAWLREDETPPAPRLVRWGVDDGGWYAEVRHMPPGNRWMAEMKNGGLMPAVLTTSGRTTWVRLSGEVTPVRLLNEVGAEIAVPEAGR